MVSTNLDSVLNYVLSLNLDRYFRGTMTLVIDFISFTIVFYKTIVTLTLSFFKYHLCINVTTIID